MGIKPKQHDDFFIKLSILLFAITSSVNRTSSRRLRNHPFLKDCMIQGDIQFCVEKDRPDDYNITSLYPCGVSVLTPQRYASFLKTLKL